MIQRQTRPISPGNRYRPRIVPASAPVLRWARTWQKQRRIQFLRPRLGLILPVSLMRQREAAETPDWRLRKFAPRTGRIAPWAVPRDPSRLFGVAPWTMRQWRRSLTGCRLSRLVVRLFGRVRRRDHGARIRYPGEVHH